jgi:hypothetical protein
MLAPIFSRVNGGENVDKLGLTEEVVVCVQGVIKSDFETIKSEVSREQKTLSRIGNSAIYSDGSLDNSSFDLMKDLEMIHAVIFSSEVPYNGTPNQSKQSSANFISNSQTYGSTPRTGFEITDTTADDLAASGWTLVPPAGGTGATDPKVPSVSEACAASGNTLLGVDPELIDDLQSQTYLGSNSSSSSGDTDGTTDATGTGSTATGAAAARNDYNSDKGFKCTGFFCIDVKFVMYDTTLLGGGNSYSIQSILEQNFKIVKEFAGSSFIQAKPTNNFFQLLLKDMDLPSMAHIGVVVTSLPAPILNLPGEKTPRGKPSQTDAQKEFDEMESGVFKDYGLSVKRSNALPIIANNERDYGISTLEALTTDHTERKLKPGRSFRSEYSAIKEAELKNEYADSFTSNLNQFEAFTKAFVDHIGNFTSLVQKIDEIPQG